MISQKHYSQNRDYYKKTIFFCRNKYRIEYRSKYKYKHNTVHYKLKDCVETN